MGDNSNNDMVAGEVQQLHSGKHALLRRISVPLALLSLAHVTTYRM